MKVFNMK